MINIIMRLDDPIVAVREAPILRRPITYDKEPINGISENKNKIIIFLGTDNSSICEGESSKYCCNVTNIVSDNNAKTMNTARMRPETNIDAPAT